MSIRESLLRLLSRARKEAGQVAQTANLRIDIRSLEGQRDHIFKDIGRHVYASREAAGPRSSEIESLCADVARVERQLAEKKAELEARRSGPEPGEKANAVG